MKKLLFVFLFLALTLTACKSDVATVPQAAVEPSEA